MVHLLKLRQSIYMRPQSNEHHPTQYTEKDHYKQSPPDINVEASRRVLKVGLAAGREKTVLVGLLRSEIQVASVSKGVTEAEDGWVGGACHARDQYM